MEAQLYSPPTPVNQLFAARDRFQQANHAPLTVIGYRYDWEMFGRWTKQQGRTQLPATTETVELYLMDLIGRGKKISTASRRTCAIAHYHREANESSPITVDVRHLLLNAQRVRCEKPLQKKALTVEELRAIAAALMAKGTPRATRNRAILVMGFASALRRSNLVALEFADVEFTEQGIVLAITREKQDQHGRGRYIGLPQGRSAETCPVQSLRAWLEFRKTAAGKLFTRLDPGGFGLAMDAEAVAKIVKECVTLIGLDPELYGAHSLRAGFVTAAAEAGISDLMIAAQSGHRSLRTLRIYLRRTNLFKSNPAGMIGL